LHLQQPQEQFAGAVMMWSGSFVGPGILPYIFKPIFEGRPNAGPQKQHSPYHHFCQQQEAHLRYVSDIKFITIGRQSAYYLCIFLFLKFSPGLHNHKDNIFMPSLIS